MRTFALLILPALFAAPACGYGLLQTARTVPAGEVELEVGGGLLSNALAEERAYGSANLPLEVGARFGASDRVDVGARLFLGAGVLADAKVGLLDPASPFALAVQAGVGAARDLGGDGAVLHVPVNLVASYDLGAHVTPYAALGWGSFWVFGRDPVVPDAGATAVARTGTGDGLALGTLGVELKVGPLGLLGEYRYWKPVLDDPGDGFGFVDEHLFLLGVRARMP